MTPLPPPIPYVCGPLTNLTPFERIYAKALYSKIGDTVERITGRRAFVPHEHCDPIKAAHLTPEEVDAIERMQVSKNTDLLIIVYIADSFGSGIEMEIARENDVDGVLFHPEGQTVSRLVLGNKCIRNRQTDVMSFASESELLEKLIACLKKRKITSAVDRAGSYCPP